MGNSEQRCLIQTKVHAATEVLFPRSTEGTKNSAAVMVGIVLASACFGNFGVITFRFFNFFILLRITDDGSVPEMRIWSLLVIKSDWKQCIHLRRNLFYIYMLSDPRGHSTADFGWFVAFEEHHNFPCQKMLYIVIIWVYFTIPYGLSLFWQFGVSLFNFLNYFVWLRITDEGSVPEIRLWSLLSKSDLKRCIHLSKISFSI